MRGRPLPVVEETGTRHHRQRTNSSAVAQALGLSQTPPSEYGRLGGPGIVSRSRSRSRVRDGPAEAAGKLERSGTASSSSGQSSKGVRAVPASASLPSTS